jgi:hypothetical protein
VRTVARGRARAAIAGCAEIPARLQCARRQLAVHAAPTFGKFVHIEDVSPAAIFWRDPRQRTCGRGRRVGFCRRRDRWHRRCIAARCGVARRRRRAGDPASDGLCTGAALQQRHARDCTSHDPRTGTAIDAGYQAEGLAHLILSLACLLLGAVAAAIAPGPTTVSNAFSMASSTRKPPKAMQ